MTYTVSERSKRAIISLADNHEDNPFGITDLRLTHDLDVMLSAALEGVDTDTAARLLASLEAAYENEDRGRVAMHGDMDGLMVELIEHLGLDPLVVAWMARTGGSLCIFPEAGPDHSIEIDPWTDPMETSCDTMITLASDVVWIGAHTISVPVLPEIVSGLCVGRPLRDVFSHPVLDGHEITITEAFTPEGTSDERPTTHLRIDYTMDMLEATDLFKRRRMPA